MLPEGWTHRSPQYEQANDEGAGQVLRQMHRRRLAQDWTLAGIRKTRAENVHHLLAGSYREQRAALNLLKYLANDLKISIVLVGTDDAMLALGTDAQTRSRFTPFEIPRWRESEGFRRLLSAFEKVLPLRRPSHLSERSMVKLILGCSEGLTGAVSKLLNEAAEMAIRDGSEQISGRHIEQAIGVVAHP